MATAFFVSGASNLRPIRRFTAKIVFSGLVTAWRLAIWPTSRSPVSTRPIIEGVVRLPSLLGITTGSPPSITATQELVVPRSIPMTLLIQRFSWIRLLGDNHQRGAEQPAVEGVARHHLGHYLIGRYFDAFHVLHGFVKVWIERLPQRKDRLHAVFGEGVLEQLSRHRHAAHQAGEIGGAVAVVQRAVQVVHHRQKVGEDFLGPKLFHLLFFFFLFGCTFGSSPGPPPLAASVRGPPEAGPSSPAPFLEKGRAAIEPRRFHWACSEGFPRSQPRSLPRRRRGESAPRPAWPRFEELRRLLRGGCLPRIYLCRTRTQRSTISRRTAATNRTSPLISSSRSSSPGAARPACPPPIAYSCPPSSGFHGAKRSLAEGIPRASPLLRWWAPGCEEHQVRLRSAG